MRPPGGEELYQRHTALPRNTASQQVSQQALGHAVDERNGQRALLMSALGLWGLAALVFGCWVLKRLFCSKKRPRRAGEPRTDLLRRY
mmetsp:Transcript_35374/g.103642  ORF Transcript_35374/g.103642 Transcript_35374/m.103642 type:complete len:88 (+) Transcript_35374:76-339(+)